MYLALWGNQNDLSSPNSLCLQMFLKKFLKTQKTNKHKQKHSSVSYSEKLCCAINWRGSTLKLLRQMTYHLLLFIWRVHIPDVLKLCPWHMTLQTVNLPKRKYWSPVYNLKNTLVYLLSFSPMLFISALKIQILNILPKGLGLSEAV